MGEYFKKSDLVRSLFDYMDGKKTIGQCIDDCPTVDLKQYEWRGGENMNGTFSISKEIISCDFFIMLPPKAQVLFFHLCANANEDGIVRNGLSLQKILDASRDDFEKLEANDLVFFDENDLINICHWRIHKGIDKCNIAEV